MDGQSKIWPDFSRWPTVIITPVTSSPYHSQSNGKAEAALKIAKTMLKKVTQGNLDINLAILAWCNTPTEGSVYSPVQKLQSRQTRTQLPTSSEKIKQNSNMIKQPKNCQNLLLDNLFTSSPPNIEIYGRKPWS